MDGIENHLDLKNVIFAKNYDPEDDNERIVESKPTLSPRSQILQIFDGFAKNQNLQENFSRIDAINNALSKPTSFEILKHDGDEVNEFAEITNFDESLDDITIEIEKKKNVEFEAYKEE